MLRYRENMSIFILQLGRVHFMSGLQEEGAEGSKVEYRVWNPFRSKLAAAILGGVDKIHIHPGSKVLYLGAASGTTVSHVADIVGPVSTVCHCKVDIAHFNRRIFAWES